MTAVDNDIQLTAEQKREIVKQVSQKMESTGMKSAIAIFDSYGNRVLNVWPDKAYDPDTGKNRPQIFQEGRTDIFEPFFVIPRLYELRNYLPLANKNTNIYLYKLDGTVQNLVEQRIAKILGDGTKITIYGKRSNREDKRLTKIARNWARRAGGKGRSLDNYVIPWIVIDNVTTGNVLFVKYIGGDDDNMVEKGDLALVRVDPRLYTVITHDQRLWRKFAVYPIKQTGLPKTRAEFEKWNPTYRDVYSPVSSMGYVNYEEPVVLHDNTYYECPLFLGIAPLSSIISEMISTIELRYYRDNAYKKVALPPILIRVSRHATRDADDTKFLEKLEYASTIGAELRTGDSIAHEGDNYDADGNVLSKGWEIQALDLKGKTLDFAAAFRLIDEQKAYGLRTTMAVLTPHGLGGERHTLGAGANAVNQDVASAKTMRAKIRDFIIDVITDVIFLKTNVKLDYEQIDVQFTETREQDASGFANILFGAYDRNVIDEEEFRNHLLRVGLKLEFKKREDVLAEMMEKQMAMQAPMEGGMEGMEGGEGAAGAEEGEGEEEEEGPIEAFPGQSEIVKRIIGGE